MFPLDVFIREHATFSEIYRERLELSVITIQKYVFHNILLAWALASALFLCGFTLAYVEQRADATETCLKMSTGTLAIGGLLQYRTVSY